MAVLTVPTVDDDGHEPDVGAFDPVVALDEALRAVLHLELGGGNAFLIAAAWTRVHALTALAP